MVVRVLVPFVFLSLSYAQIYITGSDGRNYTFQGQRYGINCSVPASLDTSIVMLKGLERVCSLLMESCPILPSDRFPCGCSVKASGDRILYHITDHATVEGFDDQWLCKEFNSTKMTPTLDVTVYSGPNNIRLNSSSRVVISRGGSAQSVQCSADCNPPCSYFWHKGSTDTAPVVFKSRVLPVDIIEEELPGSHEYTCIAINRNKSIPKRQTIVLQVIVEPPKPAPSIDENNKNVSMTNSTTSSVPSASTTTTTLQTTTIQSTTTTTRPTTTLQTTTPTTTITVAAISTTAETVSQRSDTQELNGLVVGIIVGALIVLVVIAIVIVLVVFTIYKRGQRQARISRTISNAPGNPIYVNNPNTVGGMPNLQGTVMITNDEYTNYSQGAVDQHDIRSPTYINTTQPPLYSSLDKEQLKEKPSYTYEQLGAPETANPQFNPYTHVENEQKHGASEAQSQPPGSPVYMNTGNGSDILGTGTNDDSSKIDANDVSDEPVSLEYMNLNLPKT